MKTKFQVGDVISVTYEIYENYGIFIITKIINHHYFYIYNGGMFTGTKNVITKDDLENYSSFYLLTDIFRGAL